MKTYRYSRSKTLKRNVRTLFCNRLLKLQVKNMTKKYEKLDTLHEKCQNAISKPSFDFVWFVQIPKEQEKMTSRYFNEKCENGMS